MSHFIYENNFTFIISKYVKSSKLLNQFGFLRSIVSNYSIVSYVKQFIMQFKDLRPFLWWLENHLRLAFREDLTWICSLTHLTCKMKI